MMWNDKQFWADSLWRGLRTFCQTLYGLLIVVQITPDVSIPWQGYMYASAVAALTSLLQSIGRERVAISVRSSEPVANQEPVQPAVPVLGCGDSLR